MRNLKRALSLGLTAAMISGLMVMGSSAASYADVTSEDNQEAIEVLQAVGIMVGDENGDFNPDQKVTRNEMAVVMSNLMAYNVKTYAGTSPFTDVPSWAEPYVAACWTNGITAGTSATTYGGSESVTTAQAALMLMKALGYFQYSSDFGSDWQLSTVSQGNKIDLFDNVDSGVRDAMTRNDLAQLVLNTLEAGTVEAETDGNIQVGDIVITNNVKYNYITSTRSYAGAISKVKDTANASDAQGYIVELGEKLYQGDLVKDNGGDDFGRPASVWSYKNDEIGTYVDDAEGSWTEKVTEKMLYSAAGSTAVDQYTWFTYVDGKKVEFNPDDLSKNGTDRVLKSGNGVLTEVFVDTDEENVYLTSINTYVAEVSKVVENEDDYTVTVNFKAQPADLKNIDREFDTTTELAKDDIVLVTVADNTIKSIAKAESVSGTVNSVKENDYLKMGGATYNYNYAYTIDSVIKGYDKAKGLYDLDASEGANPEAGNDATIYLDTYGNAIAIEKADVSVDDYLYVKGTDEAYNEVSAKVVFSDGTEGTIDIDELNGISINDETKIKVGEVYKFSKSGSDYDLTTINKVDGKGGVEDRTGTQVLKDLVITKESAGFTGYIDTNDDQTADKNEEFSANSNTVYVDVENGKVFTGYRNVPGMTSATGGYVVEKNNVAEIVFLKDAGKYDVDDDSFFFVKSTGDVTVVDTEDGKCYEWTVYVNGKKETLTMTSSANNEIKHEGVGMYSIESTDKHDYVEDVDFKVGGTDLTTSYATTAEKDILKLYSTDGDLATGKNTVFAYDSETTFMVVELKDGKPDGDNIYAGSVSNIETDKDGRTGVYVMNVEDKNTTKTPLATLVLVIVPEDDGSDNNAPIDISGLYIQEDEDGNLVINTAEKLGAKDVADAIMAYLNDSDISKVEYNAQSKTATITYSDSTTTTLGVTVNKVASEEEVTAIKVVDEAIAGVIKSGYKWKGDITVTGNEVKAEGKQDYVTGSPTGATADLARFLGALYRDCNASKIVFDKVAYTWNAESDRLGSNWEHEGETLVSAIVAKFTDIAVSGGTQSVELTVDGCPMTFTLTVSVTE